MVQTLPFILPETGQIQEIIAMASIEQEARDMLERMGVEDAQSMTVGDVVELANLIREVRYLKRVAYEQYQTIAHSPFYLMNDDGTIERL